MKILVADDSRTSLAILTASLQELGHTVTGTHSGEEAIEAFTRDRPDLIILDVLMGGMNGFECAKQIRSLDSNEWIPLIFLSGNLDDASIAAGIDAGGDDYLTKPFSDITLAAKIKAMQRISDMRNKLCDLTTKLLALSVNDTLTGLYNRLKFNQELAEKMAEARRHKDNIALLFIDLDGFKLVNDKYGHQMGDILLQQVAQRAKAVVRISDFIARLGGDEFAVISNRFKDISNIKSLALKLINELSRPYQLPQHEVMIGASIGIAFFPADAISPEELIRKSDTAMYHVKMTGRNNFAVFSKEMDGGSIDEFSSES